MRTALILLSMLIATPAAAAKFVCIKWDGSSQVTSDPSGCKTMIALPEEQESEKSAVPSRPVQSGPPAAKRVPAVIPGNVKARFINPMDFNGSEFQKQEVIAYIKARVRHDYCESGLDMCQNTTLRMMEKKNLVAFKEATRATDRSVMDRVIKDYCYSRLDMCNYTTIWMMYKKNSEAGRQSLSW